VKAAKALVLEGDGINCEQEATWALKMAGFEVSNKHVSELLQSPQELKNSKLLCIPGGFAFGDEIASGKVLAVKIRHHMQEQLQEFVDAGNLLLAICNGFQVVVQMGLLPNSEAGAPRLVSLARNARGKFINRWVTMNVTQSPAAQIYFAGLKEIDLPMRHGEGNIKLEAAGEQNDDLKRREDIVKEHAALRYTEDVNGSYDRIASLTNKSGTVMGIMPHPEAFVRWTQHPQWTSRKRLQSSLSEGALSQGAPGGVTPGGIAPGGIASRGSSGSAPGGIASGGSSGSAPGVTALAQTENGAVPDGLRIFQNAYNYIQNAF
jgi:phosphoribosylformylglycinamidine synthase subunit PurQ / glutaminase